MDLVKGQSISITRLGESGTDWMGSAYYSKTLVWVCVYLLSTGLTEVYLFHVAEVKAVVRQTVF
jgi:hypothetical protein